jgi:Tfp pilus assembly protein PilV
MQNTLHRTGGLYIRSYDRFCRKHGMSLVERLLANVFLVAGVLVEAAIAVVKYRSIRRACSTLGSLWYGYVVAPR